MALQHFELPFQQTSLEISTSLAILHQWRATGRKGDPTGINEAMTTVNVW